LEYFCVSCWRRLVNYFNGIIFRWGIYVCGVWGCRGTCFLVFITWLLLYLILVDRWFGVRSWRDDFDHSFRWCYSYSIRFFPIGDKIDDWKYLMGVYNDWKLWIIFWHGWFYFKFLIGRERFYVVLNHLFFNCWYVILDYYDYFVNINYNRLLLYSYRGNIFLFLWIDFKYY
jgi:hypothetical protein